MGKTNGQSGGGHPKKTGNGIPQEAKWLVVIAIIAAIFFSITNLPAASEDAKPLKKRSHPPNGIVAPHKNFYGDG